MKMKMWEEDSAQNKQKNGYEENHKSKKESYKFLRYLVSEKK